MGCPVDPIHHFIVKNYCETTFSSCLFGFAKLCKALMASAYHCVHVALCKVTSFQSLSQPANAAVQRFWCTRLISTEVALVTIYLWLIKTTAAYRQGSIFKMKQACVNIT